LARQHRTPQILLALILMVSSTAFFGCDPDEDKEPVGPTNEELRLSSQTLPLAIRFASYAEIVEPTGGTTPYSFTASNLPPGLSLIEHETNFTISGTPTDADTYIFSVTVTDQDNTQVTANFTIQVVFQLDLTGTWSFVITTTVVNGDCSGEDIGIPDTTTITIVQTGDDLIASGFLSDPINEIPGIYYSPSMLNLKGCYSEDGGTTVASHNLMVYSPDEIAGWESWAWWDIPYPDSCLTVDSDCPLGASNVTATRISP